MDVTKKTQRQALAKSLDSSENKQRKALSLKQAEIYSDRLFQYVKEELLRHFDRATVNEMPIVSFVNFPRRIVQQEASIYRDDPKRTFSDLNDDQQLLMEQLYEDCQINSKLKMANQKYKLQDQTHILVYPENGKLSVKVLYQHQIDAIPDPNNPEVAEAYVISSFDKQKYLSYEFAKSATGESGISTIGNSLGDSASTPLASKEDYKKASTFFTYWSKDHNFVFNGHGDVVDPNTREPILNPTEEDMASPIPGVMPIIDVSQNKDFEYFVRSGLAVTDFGVQYNAAMSDTWHIARLQGYSVAVLKAPDGTMPENLKMGPNLILNLKTDPNNGLSAGDIDFQFASPSPDIPATLQLLETMLMNFVSSRGLDPKEIAQSGTRSFSSALERMLAMIDEFEASRDDFKVFMEVERHLYKIIKHWLTNAQDQLEDYQIAIPEDSYLSVKFEQPEMLQTGEEKISYWNKRIENGTATRVDAIMDIDGLTKEQAEEKVMEIDNGRFFQEDNQGRGESDIQPG